MITLSVWDPKKRCRVLNPEAFDPPPVLPEPEIDMTGYKTVLAPNAPWPGKPVEKPKPAPRVRVPPPPKSPSKIARTDKMFEQWAAKQIGIKHGT